MLIFSPSVFLLLPLSILLCILSFLTSPSSAALNPIPSPLLSAFFCFFLLGSVCLSVYFSSLLRLLLFFFFLFSMSLQFALIVPICFSLSILAVASAATVIHSYSIKQARRGEIFYTTLLQLRLVRVHTHLVRFFSCR